jgi:hypothetical protein
MAGKIEIPENLKKDLPLTKWGKILAATPVVMAVIATMLAGLASSEMTKAQYDRSFAAQLQSKAGDQWNYYQAKKLRSAFARNSLDVLLASGENVTNALPTLGKMDSATIAALTKNELPAAALPKFDDKISAALDALENSKPELEISNSLANISATELQSALNAAQQSAQDFDAAIKPISKNVDKLDDALMSGDKTAFRNFAASRLRFTSARYDAESGLNQIIGSIYELQVRQNNYSAERHRQRSGKFFYGMLAAQLAVIIATFAIAARQRNLLWSLAAAAGACAVSFSIYVYLRV